MQRQAHAQEERRGRHRRQEGGAATHSDLCVQREDAVLSGTRALELEKCCLAMPHS